MKKRNRKTGRLFAAMVLATVLLSLLAMPAHAAGGPFTEGVKTLWDEHSGEIFSALALAGSVLVAVLYKVGLHKVTAVSDSRNRSNQLQRCDFWSLTE